MATFKITQCLDYPTKFYEFPVRVEGTHKGMEYNEVVYIDNKYKEYLDEPVEAKDIEVFDTQVKVLFNFMTKYDTPLKLEMYIDITPFYEYETPSLFDNDVTSFTWDDGITSRDCHTRLILFCKNKMILFTGKSIDGVVVVENTEYHKNGKWSSTTYHLKLAAGWKYNSLRQGFNSGVYIDDATSPNAIAKALGVHKLVSNAVVMEFVKLKFNKAYTRYTEYISKIEKLEQALGDTDIVQYTYERYCPAKRMGDNMLIINGKVWDFKENEIVKIVNVESVSGMRGGSTQYKLLLPANVEVEEQFEYDPYKDNPDALEHRFESW